MVHRHNTSYELSGEKEDPAPTQRENEMERIEQAAYEVGGGGKNRKYLGERELGREKELPLY